MEERRGCGRKEGRLWKEGGEMLFRKDRRIGCGMKEKLWKEGGKGCGRKERRRSCGRKERRKERREGEGL